MKEIENTLKFGEESYKLMFLQRYNDTPRIFTETVAAHSYQVGILSLKLCEELPFKIQVSKVLKMALIHDISEIRTGDITHPIKQKYKQLNEILEAEEISTLKKLLGDEYALLIIEYNDCKTVDSLIVNIADVMSCKIYAQQEIKLGNANMKRVLLESNNRLKKLSKQLENKTWKK
jgi:putative hydrolases of HD superfamily